MVERRPRTIQLREGIWLMLEMELLARLRLEALEMLAAASAKALRQAYWNDGENIVFPVDPFAIAAKMGIEVARTPLSSDLAGFILKEPGENAKIVVNAADAPVRQRFTVAHEIGHYAHNKLSDNANESLGFVDYRNELTSRGVNPDEIWANAFAAELIMPAAVLKKWWAEGKALETIRNKFDVSKAALAYRMANLGLVA